jgi:hypothetical protein
MAAAAEDAAPASAMTGHHRPWMLNRRNFEGGGADQRLPAWELRRFRRP